MNRRLFLFIFLGFLVQISICPAVFCQEFSWKYYSINDGLPQTQITKIFQDSKGYIWIATKGGVSKFDGVEFENFTLKDGLDGELIEHIQEDFAGKIYLGSRYGINTYHNGQIRSIRLPDIDQGFRIAVDNSGRIWVIVRSNKVLCIEDGKINYNHPLLPYLEDDEQIYFGGSDHINGEISFWTNKGRFILWNGSQSKILENRQEISGFQFDRSGNIYGISEDSIFSYKSGKFNPFYYKDEPVSLLRIYSEDDIYFKHKYDFSKLYHFDGNSTYRFEQDFNMITCVFKDDQGILWVGTESGLWQLQSKGFQNYLADPDDNFYTWTVLQDKQDNYWLGSFYKGLKKYDGNQFTDIPVDHLFETSKNGNRLINWQKFYSGAIRDKRGDLLFTTAQGILKYDGANINWYYSKYPETIMYIYEDIEEDKLIISSAHNGIIELADSSNVYYHTDRQSVENTGLVTSILKDKYSRLWISGMQGISIKENGKWRNLPDEKDSIYIGAISMIKDHCQNIWLGSNDGLYFYDYHNLKRIDTSTFDRQIGILNINNNKELLIGSIGGIGLLDLAAFYADNVVSIRFFDSKNGFLGTECKHNSSFLDKNDNFWICTSDRVVKVNPSELRSNPYPPRVYIKDISTLSKNMEWKPAINVSDEKQFYKFDSNQGDIRFNYHGISHDAPHGVKYQTMLEGYDDGWSAITKERYRTYTNLPQGTYTYQVKAANIDGIWTDKIASVRFIISPAWHELSSVRLTGLFIITMLAAGLGYVFSERIKKERLEKEKNEKQIAKLQFKSLKGLIDPHFTFNAINSIAAMVYKENRDEAYHYFTKFSRLIRTAFDNSEQTTRSIKDEIKFVQNYLDIEKLRFKDRFEYEISKGKEINTDWKIPKMIIQIYVENAIKHGLIHRQSGGLLRIKLSVENDFMKISVMDNGVGINYSKALKHSSKSLGIGTNIMKDYFNLLNKFNEYKIQTKTININDEDRGSQGTKVLISIPLNFKYTV